MNRLEWIGNNIPPSQVGKYVIETKTLVGNIHRLEACWNGESWSVSNQIVLRWLKEN